MKTFAIGDVHGQHGLLEGLLERIRGRSERGDTLLFVGDYVDRGPDSKRVIDRVLALAAGEWDGPVVTLRGNHEQMWQDALDDPGPTSEAQWRRNGGTETLTSYFGRKVPRDWRERIPQEHLDFLENLQERHEDEHAHYAHAGFRPGASAEEQVEFDLLWIREEFLGSDYDWGKPVVFGHTPQCDFAPSPLQPPTWRALKEPNKIGIDTGAAFGGPLTALIMPGRTTIACYPG